MTLTEKVRGSLGGHQFRVYEAKGLSQGAVTFNPANFGLHFIHWAEYTPTKCTLSAGATTLPVMKTAESSVGGTTITLSGIIASADSGIISVWGW